MQTHALGLAQRLVTVSLLDREISIRRAASAAFQECVGRLVRGLLGWKLISEELGGFRMDANLIVRPYFHGLVAGSFSSWNRHHPQNGLLRRQRATQLFPRLRTASSYVSCCPVH